MTTPNGVQGPMSSGNVALLTCLFLACGRDAAPVPTAPPVAAKGIELGTSIHLIGDLEGLTFGMTMSDARAKVPGLRAPEYAPVPGSDLAGALPPPPPPPPRRPGDASFDSLVLEAKPQQYQVYFVDDRLTSVEMELDGVTAKDVWKAWGAPFDTGKELVVTDPERGLRAVVEPFATDSPLSLKIEPMVSLGSLIDPDPRKVAGVQVIGRPIADVMRDFKPRAVAQTATTTYELPSTEYSFGGDTSLTFYRDEAGVVDGWNLDGILYDPNDAAWDAVMATYAKAWGDKVEVEEQRVVFRRKPLVTVNRITAMATVTTRE